MDNIINTFFNTETPTETLKEENFLKDIFSETIIGIDLGTTNSCVAVFRNNNLEIITDEYGNRTVPSIVSFSNNKRYVGIDAKNQKELNPKNAIYEVKRLIGQKFTDCNVQNDRELLSYDIATGIDDNIIIKTDKKDYSPEEISSIILTKLKNMASQYLKDDIKKAVITVPAYFTDSQRQATKDSATIAGLECVRIINEPTSAALAYGLMNRSKYKDRSLNIIVYDLGGGTTDCSLLNITDGVFEVLCSVGNTHLGGTDFDAKIIRYCINIFKNKNSLSENITDFYVSPLSLQKLRKACENAKILLSGNDKTVIAVKDFYKNIDLVVPITCEIFNNCCKDLLILCMKPIHDVLIACAMQKNQIDEIILVGGMTKMPIIRTNIKNLLGLEPNCSVNPDEVVAAGAAIQAYIISNRKDPFSEYVTLLDIVSLSIGIETDNGLFDIIIPRNTNLPATKRKLYTTDTDDSESVMIKIFEGERKMTKDNYFVGEFELSGIPKAPRGFPEIEVKFSLDINGIITVQAVHNNKYKDTQIKKTVVITGNKGRLKPDDINRLVKEANEYEINDHIEKNKKQLYNQLRDLCNIILENIQNKEFKITESDVLKVQEEISEIIIWNTENKTSEEYDVVVKKLHQKYGTLILRDMNTNKNVKSCTQGSSNSTGIYDNSEDMDAETNTNTIFEKLVKEEFNCFNDDNELQEMKQLKNNIIMLCTNIYEIVQSESFISSKKIELRDYIDDTLLWVHSHCNPTKQEYMEKITEINDNCDKIIDYGSTDNKIFTDVSKKEELEQLCINIKCSIPSFTSVRETNKVMLSAKVEEYLEWIVDEEVAKREKELLGELCIEPDYDTKINVLNTMCNDIYSSLIVDNIISLP